MGNSVEGIVGVNVVGSVGLFGKPKKVGVTGKQVKLSLFKSMDNILKKTLQTISLQLPTSCWRKSR